MKSAASLIALALAFATTAAADGKHNGWGAVEDTTVTTTQGRSGKPANPNASPNNKGTATTTTTTTTVGPKGQIDKGNTDCHNCETSSSTTTSGPGNK